MPKALNLSSIPEKNKAVQHKKKAVIELNKHTQHYDVFLQGS
jgi:hypothetical protein